MVSVIVCYVSICFIRKNDKLRLTGLTHLASVMRRHHPGEAVRCRHGVVAPAVAPAVARVCWMSGPSGDGYAMVVTLSN